MASLTGKIRMVRDARREVAPPPTKHFEEYRPTYRELLSETKSLGGDPVLSELAEWIADRTRETGSLPAPDEVRQQARTICSRQDIDVPDDSPIQG